MLTLSFATAWETVKEDAPKESLSVFIRFDSEPPPVEGRFLLPLEASVIGVLAPSIDCLGEEAC